MKGSVETFEAGAMRMWTQMVGEGKDGEPLPLLCLLDGEDMPGSLDAMLREGKRLPGGEDLPAFLAVSFEPIDWNHSFSPWEAPAVHVGSGPFTGGGRETLAGIEQTVLPETARRYPIAGREGRFVMGYSLSALFALWTMYESGAFGGCACDSGSLWFDGWMEYMRANHPRADSRIRLSLGKKEEKTRNRRFAAIGEATREAAELLAQEENVAESTLVLHDGGHGHEVARRRALSMIWLLRTSRRSKHYV